MADGFVRLIRRTGPHPTERLRKAVAVRSLANDPSKPVDRQAGGLSFADTTGALAEAGVLSLGDEVSLTEAFAVHLGERDPARALATWLLNENQTGVDPSGDDSTRHGPTHDLAHDATWFLHIDPSGPWPTMGRDGRDRSPVERLRQDTGRTLPPTTFDDVAEWTRFKRWMSYLGLAEERPGNALDPDPTQAVRWAVEDAGVHGHVAIDAFLNELAAFLPMFGGHLEHSWHGRGPEEEEATTFVRPTLAHALVRLDRGGLLRLDPGADASGTRVLSFGNYGVRRSPVGEVRPGTQRVAAVVVGGDA